MNYSPQQQDALMRVAQNRKLKNLVKEGIDMESLNDIASNYNDFNALVAEYEENPKLQSDLDLLEEFQIWLEILFRGIHYQNI